MAGNSDRMLETARDIGRMFGMVLSLGALIILILAVAAVGKWLLVYLFAPMC